MRAANFKKKRFNKKLKQFKDLIKFIDLISTDN